MEEGSTKRGNGRLPPDPAFETLLRHLSQTRGFDFTAYKRSTLMRRTRVRMQALQLESFEDYLDYLEVDPDEFGRFFDAILINVTSFFRDPLLWERLRKEVVPAIIEASAPDEPIRVWCPACATGQEAYSLLMLFADAMGPNRALGRVKIYATDVDERALEVARQATYPTKQFEDMPEERRDKYFERTGPESWTLRRDLRRMAIFGRHDLLHDAPISKVDLLSCRNTLMYFNAESQRRVLARLFYAIREGGFLVLGQSESLLSRNAEVRPLDLKLRLFVKVSAPETRNRLLARVSGTNAPHQDGAPTSAERRLHESAFDTDPSAMIVVDTEGLLVLANRTARRLFTILDRDIGRPLQEHELSYRPVELRSLLDRAASEQRPFVVRDTEWPGTDGAIRWIDTHVLPLIEAGDLLGVKFVFADTTSFRQLQSELETSHGELETAYEELESSNEELETTNEELHSTVEELETTNEELQSTNEELETTNEELQSSNEELETLNNMLQERTGELDRANEYLTSILASIRLGVVVLNRGLEVQIWNTLAENQWGVRSDEARGQHFLSLDIGLPVTGLVQPIRDCLTGADPPPVVVAATNRRGRAIQCTVTLRPLRLTPQRIDGIVLLIENEETDAGNGAPGGGERS